jgi:hypothetical protein
MPSDVKLLQIYKHDLLVNLRLLPVVDLAKKGRTPTGNQWLLHQPQPNQSRAKDQHLHETARNNCATSTSRTSRPKSRIILLRRTPRMRVTSRVETVRGGGKEHQSPSSSYPYLNPYPVSIAPFQNNVALVECTQADPWNFLIFRTRQCLPRLPRTMRDRLRN